MSGRPEPSTDQQDRAERLVARLLREHSADVDADRLLRSARRLAARQRRILRAVELAIAALVVLALTGLFQHALVDRAPRHLATVLGDGRELHADTPAELALADGSTLRLAGGARCRLLTRRPDAPAVEILSGQAFFDVAPGRGPFIVATPLCTIRTVGTSFLVDAPEYHPDRSQGEPGMSVFRVVKGAVVVAVFSGVVELANPHGSLRLEGGGVALAEEASAPAKLEKDLGPGVGLTVYNGNFAVVKERREMDLPKGAGEVKFTGVAKTIDATSVHFISLSDPAGVQVLDQNYEYDLVSPEKILEKYLDRDITVVLKGSGGEGAATLKGTLIGFGGARTPIEGNGLLTKQGSGNLILSGANDFDVATQRLVRSVPQSYQATVNNNYVGGTLIALSTPALVLRVADGTRIINRCDILDLQLGPLPAGLITRPTLVWKTLADKGGKHLVKVSYMAGNIDWHADYTAVLNAADTAVDISGWVTITNQSGTRYQDAQLKLIAGDVRRIAPPEEPDVLYDLANRAVEKEKKQLGFEEKSFAEYHMYTLPRPTTVNDNQVKQIELIEPALGVPVVKFYEYRPNPNYKKVNVKVEFDNRKENKLGIALPKGKVRVFKKDDADGSLEFVGEDAIDHTPKDEKVTLYIGDAFDIVCETKQTKAESGERWSRQGFEVEVRNHKEEPIEVRVLVSVGANYRVESATIDGQKAEHKEKDAFTLEFRVKADRNGKSKLAYTVYHSW